VGSGEREHEASLTEARIREVFETRNPKLKRRLKKKKKRKRKTNKDENTVGVQATI